MILGQNANVRHGGRTFHVQTEDSGRAHPHVITHLYYEGTILASERRDYSDLVAAPDLAARVRRLMEEQHAAMVERLRRGDFDAAIAARLDVPPAAAGPGAAEMQTPPAAETALPRPPPNAETALPRPPPNAETALPRAPRAPAPVRPAVAPVPASAAGDRAASTGRPRAFGEGIVSERPLDDVILEYLVAQSRERSGGGRGSRSEG
jgi:hypothetical protein